MQHDAHVRLYRDKRRYDEWLNRTRFRPWETVGDYRLDKPNMKAHIPIR